MSRISLGSLTIASGGTTSGELSYNNTRFMRSISITAPAALTGTVTVEANYARTGTGAWGTLTDEFGDDVTVAAGKVRVVQPVGGARLRLKSSGAEGADRVFYILGEERV
jgi:hypothetical protein